MEVNIDEELSKIIKNGFGGDDWQNKAIRVLALCLLDTRKTMDKLNAKLNIIIYLFSSVIVLILLNMLKFWR